MLVGRKARPLPQRTYELTIMRIIAAEVKAVLRVQPDDTHVPLFNRYRLMPKIHRWHYIISIDVFDTCIPSARCCGLCCSSGCIQWALPARSTSQGCLWTEKWMGGKYLPVRPLSALSIFLQRNASLYLNCAVYEVSLALFSYWLQMSSSVVRAIVIGLSKKSCDRCHSWLQSLYARFSLRLCTAWVLSLKASCEYPAVETSDKDFRYICDIEWTRF